MFLVNICQGENLEEGGGRGTVVHGDGKEEKENK